MEQIPSFEPGRVHETKITHADGYAYLVGIVKESLPGQQSLGGSDAFLRKYDPYGSILLTTQFGTSDHDSADDVSATSTAVYVVGYTAGSLSGEAQLGGGDAFVRKYDLDGNELWTRQFGSSGYDAAEAVFADATGVSIVGNTRGALQGQTNAGDWDVFVRRYDPNGNELWTRQFGTWGLEWGRAVSGDATGIYVVGQTNIEYPQLFRVTDAFVRKYDRDGNLLWAHEFGAMGTYPDPRYWSSAVALDLVSTAAGIHVLWIRGSIPFVRSYDMDGNEVATYGLDGHRSAVAISADDTGIYVAGRGYVAGYHDEHGAYVLKYDLDWNPLWASEYGTRYSEPYSISADGSGLYVSGTVGRGNVGRLDLDGSVVWSEVIYALGERQDSWASSVDACGNVYVAGHALGVLPATLAQGKMFLRKYDADCNELWTRSCGNASTYWNYSTSVSVDVTGIYIVGYALASSFYGLIWKYDSDGNELWNRSLGSSSHDFVESACSDVTGVYVTGYTHGALPGMTSLGSTDAFVLKYDTEGNELWTRQFGTSGRDEAHGVFADETGIYVVGMTTGALPGATSLGLGDAFVRKYDEDGNELWTRQYGTSAWEEAIAGSADCSGAYVGLRTSVFKIDEDGNELWEQYCGGYVWDVCADDMGVQVAGSTWGALPGFANLGGEDAFVRRYLADGTESWAFQFGSPVNDYAMGVSASHLGVFVVGNTLSFLYGRLETAFVAKVQVDIEPPVAEAGPDLAIHAGQTVYLDGSGSLDDTSLTADLVFDWSFDTKPPDSTAELAGVNPAAPSFVADLPGDYIMRLIVIDEAGNVSDPDLVLVSSLNVGPTAVAGDDMLAVVSTTVMLDGLESFDPDEDPLQFVWTLVTSPPGSEAMLVDADSATPSLTPDLEGSYVLELVLHDGFEDSQADSVQIVALSATDYTQIRLQQGSELVLGFETTDFDAPGHRGHLTNNLAKVANFVQKGNLDQAQKHLSMAITRTDGYAMRGELDPKGAGQVHPADFVVDEQAQRDLYEELKAALETLLTTP